MHLYLLSVENFQYLGSYISNQSDIEVDIRARLGKATLVFQRLNRTWSSRSINSTIKFRLYASCYLQHFMFVKHGSQRRVSATPWMCSIVDVSVVARLCHQRAVDEIWDASPIAR